MQYKLGVDEDSCVYCVDTNYWIPSDPENTHYQEYLEWLAEGNQPLPADQNDYSYSPTAFFIPAI